MIRFVNEHRDRFGVELICQVLRPAVRGFFTSRGYRAAVGRAPSARQLQDDLLVPEIARLHAENYGVYGRRKMHALMRRQGWDIGRDQTGFADKSRSPSCAGAYEGDPTSHSARTEGTLTAPGIPRSRFTDSPEVVRESATHPRETSPSCRSRGSGAPPLVHTYNFWVNG
ncbi:IS3 family transposase (plasmid) [Microbacterium sp. WHRI 7836]|uniref:IS3 family transposase n=1 Tax=Microbacterium sp. WHRI 7836 TaxID=3162563 RepID=UPI0032EE5908